MPEYKIKIEPQPKLPVVGFFHGSEEYETFDAGWCYQSPETSPDVPGLVFNVPHEFEDPDQPEKVGGLYRGRVIKRVRCLIENEVAYWLINTNAMQRITPPTSS